MMAKQGTPQDIQKLEAEMEEETQKILSSLPPLESENLPELLPRFSKEAETRKDMRPILSGRVPKKGEDKGCWDIWEAAWNEYLAGRGQ